MDVPAPSRIRELAPLTAALDAMSHAQRVEWLCGLPRGELAPLFDLARGHPVDVGYFLHPDGRPRVHEGMNNMAMFRRFQKRFADVDGVVAGYNHPMGGGRQVVWFQGYGPFLVWPSPEVEGEVWIDYRRVPPQRAEFPTVRPNAGTRWVVYGGMVDVMRRVAADVTVGAPSVKGLPVGMDARFVLVREP